MRMDHQLAERWIAPKSHILDLGCGNGDLLAHLQHKLGVTGYGLEIDEDKINEAIAKGLSIVEQDLNDGLGRFADDSFDTVVMARALQAVKAPDVLLLKSCPRSRYHLPQLCTLAKPSALRPKGSDASLRSTAL